MPSQNFHWPEPTSENGGGSNGEMSELPRSSSNFPPSSLGHERLVGSFGSMHVSYNIRNEVVVPTMADIARDPGQIPHVITEGAYRSAEHYVHTYFMLTREDFFRKPRDGWRRLWIRVLHKERPSTRGKDEGRYVAVFKDVKKVRFDWTECLIPGQWVVLSCDGFRDSLLACRIRSYDDNQQQQQQCDADHMFVIEPVDSNVKLLADDDQPVGGGRVQRRTGNSVEYDLAEQSSSFFLPYEGVLQRYKLFNGDVPMSRYVVGASTNVRLPQTVARAGGYVRIGREQFKIATLKEDYPKRPLVGYPEILDDDQRVVLQEVFLRELALIQGPPGTGKTFVGVHLAAIICQNRAAMGITTPLLIVCYKNFAIDEFLKKLHKKLLAMRNAGLIVHDGPLICRVGGSCTDEYIIEKKLRWNDHQDHQREALIVGATTTGASLHTRLHSIQFQVAIVEEAGEVLESHVVASLNSSLEHLILIGDHQQLRPSTSCNELASRPYHLNVSLFERLINNGHPYTQAPLYFHLTSTTCLQLATQRRMHPFITEAIVRPHFYPHIRDGPEVLDYPEVAGVSGRLLFIDVPSKQSNPPYGGTSLQNEGEAEFVVNLVDYLLKQGQHQRDKITILSTYSAQTHLVRGKLEKRFEAKNRVRVVNVDNFQGQENDVIVLTLVRSFCDNDTHTIGFLAEKNRICVALTRARHAFYMIGNWNYLSRHSPLWRRIFESINATKVGSVVQGLPVICKKHEHQQLLRNAADFSTMAKDGGCDRRCEERKRCGHGCPRFCHPDECQEDVCQQESFYTCEHQEQRKRIDGSKKGDKKVECQALVELCTRPCTNRCPHRHCSKLCFEACDVDICLQPCPKRLACGHPCLGACSEPCPPLCLVCQPDDDVQRRLEEFGDRMAAVESCTHTSYLRRSLIPNMELWLSDRKYPTCETCRQPLASSGYGKYLKRGRLMLEERKEDMLAMNWHRAARIRSNSTEAVNLFNKEMNTTITELTSSVLGNPRCLAQARILTVNVRAKVLELCQLDEPRFHLRAAFHMLLATTAVKLLQILDFRALAAYETTDAIVELWMDLALMVTEHVQKAESRPLGTCLEQARRLVAKLCIRGLTSQLLRGVGQLQPEFDANRPKVDELVRGALQSAKTAKTSADLKRIVTHLGNNLRNICKAVKDEVTIIDDGRVRDAAAKNLLIPATRNAEKVDVPRADDMLTEIWF